jgi:predicted HicB family RNase H-like nuclease
MPRRRTEAQVVVAARIPKSLRYRLRLHCIESGVSVMEFVADAIREKLARVKRPPKR